MTAAEVYVAERVAEILEICGVRDENPELDLTHTPQRVARMFFRELLTGYNIVRLSALRKQFTTFTKRGQHELVIIRDVPFYSLCAHHMMPFFGTAALGYLPSDKVIGLSKFPRVLDHFAARLQTQEQLLSDVADFVMVEAKPEALIVVLRAQHLCCEARGVRKPGTQMVIAAVRPQPLPDHLRSEFYSLMSLRSQ